MAQRTKPPFRADHVGSLLRPPELIEAWKRFQRHEIDAEELKRVEHDSVRGVVKLQEDLGLQLATDGEYQRSSWHRDFLQQIGNVKMVENNLKMRFHTHEGDTEMTPPGFRIEGKVFRPKPIFVEHFKFLKSVCKPTTAAKITIPSPSNLHFRGGRQMVSEAAYPQMSDFFDDLAQVYREEIAGLAEEGCRYVQLDEVNFAYLCDPSLREQVKAIGEDPATLPQTYAKLLNSVIKGKPADMVVAMHLCRGNSRSAWIAEGGYEPVADVLFNQVNVDGYFLEYDSPRAGDFAPLRFVPKGKTIVLGLVTSKTAQLEKKEDLIRKIEEAAKYCPLDQLALSPQCGFASVLEGNKLTVADEIAKLKLILDVSREVWG
ncbi:MAG TPA: 5-methyltetrahydropteroyltriglutamate--homocysteine S-methyltransferase [Stellaceae bacterium]|jgi:5-methyltetrahydropteroyltriglutamate--homocysteine methyltransferase|nr:5-methyltetrahydropteroyltriglutamate--homocysteine S-methyltransferase [Stellaceae bacterium]